MNLSHARKNLLINTIIQKVSARPEIWDRREPDYQNPGFKIRCFKEIETEIKNEIHITILGEYKPLEKNIFYNVK